MKKLLLIIFIFLTLPAYSENYFCPKLPAKVQVGTFMKDNWFVWLETRENNFINRFYYRLFSEQYVANYWGGFPQGIVSGSEKYKSFIGCCMLRSDNKKGLCVYKNVKEKNCKADIRGKGPDKFVCEDSKPIKLSHEV